MGGSCSTASSTGVARPPATSASSAQPNSSSSTVVRGNPVPGAAAAAGAAAAVGRGGTGDHHLQASLPSTSSSPAPAQLHRATSTFAMTYDLLGKLGKGQYAVVHHAKHKRTQADRAVKCIKKATLTPEDLAALDVEVAAQELLKDHPNFVRMYDFFPEKEYFFIVLELISGGELFDRICQKERYSEREAREIIRQLTTAIAYMHSKGVVHRDLKPENILLKSHDDDTSIKLADLGFAKIIKSPDTLMTTPCGTPGYVAPEILSGTPYSSAADIWSMGVIFYILLCGYPPFASEKDDQRELFALIRDGRFTFPPAEWSDISDGAKDLIRHILVTDPSRRYTAEQILQHPWTNADVATIPDRPLEKSLFQLKRFNARRRLKKAIAAVRSTVRMKILLAARMQRFLNAARAARQGDGDAPDEPDTPTDAGHAVVNAYRAATARGMTIPPPRPPPRPAHGRGASTAPPDDDIGYIIAATTVPPPDATPTAGTPTAAGAEAGAGARSAVASGTARPPPATVALSPARAVRPRPANGAGMPGLLTGATSGL